MHPPAKQGGQKPTATVRQIQGKSQDVPDWATPTTVTGYTYEFALNASMVGSLMKGQYAGTPYPTVYYRNGHRTVKHKKAGNVGWEGTKRRWLFFGNVHDKWLDQDYWKDLNHTGSKLSRDEKKAFARELRDAAVGGNQGQSHKKCTSRTSIRKRSPGPSIGITAKACWRPTAPGCWRFTMMRARCSVIPRGIASGGRKPS